MLQSHLFDDDKWIFVFKNMVKTEVCGSYNYRRIFPASPNAPEDFLRNIHNGNRTATLLAKLRFIKTILQVNKHKLLGFVTYYQVSKLLVDFT